MIDEILKIFVLVRSAITAGRIFFHYILIKILLLQKFLDTALAELKQRARQ